MCKLLQHTGHVLWDRRAFFGICAAGAVAGVAWLYGEFLPEESDIAPPGPPKMVSVVDFSDSGEREGIRTVPQILKSDREWRRHLTYTSFAITRKGGTELPYTGTYWALHDKGLYRCICCGTALFSADTKFDSGTGWPSFWAPNRGRKHLNLGRPHAQNAPHCGFLPPMQCSPGTCLHGWSGTHRAQVLFEFRLAEFCQIFTKNSGLRTHVLDRIKDYFLLNRYCCAAARAQWWFKLSLPIP